MNESANPVDKKQRVLMYLVATIAVILVVAALKFTKAVTMPFVFALFVTLLLFPVYQWLEHRFPPKLHWLSLTLTMLIFILVLALFIGMGWLCVDIVGQKIPQYQSKFNQMQKNVLDWAKERNIPLSSQMIQSSGWQGQVMGFVATVANSIWTMTAFIVLIFFYTLLALLEWREWRNRARHALPRDKLRSVIDTIDVVAIKVRWYLLIRTFTSFLSALFGGLWLWFFGVDFALLWAILIFFLNFIPNIGSIIAVIPPAIFALIQNGFTGAIGVVLGLTVVEQIIGNFIDPRLQGRTLQISPVIVLFSLMLWAWIWGVVGAVLAVPIMVTLIVTFAHIPKLQPLALMLSRTEDIQDLKDDTHNHQQ